MAYIFNEAAVNFTSFAAVIAWGTLMGLRPANDAGSKGGVEYGA